MRVFSSIAELAAATGEHIGYSGWHTVTQDMIDTFARVTGDEQWIHVDVDRACSGPFEAPIAHGFLTLSLTSMLAAEVYRIDGMQMLVNYGADRVRFPAPVPVDSGLRAGVQLLSVEAKPNGCQAMSRVTVEMQGARRPACVIDRITLIVPPTD